MFIKRLSLSLIAFFILMGALYCNYADASDKITVFIDNKKVSFPDAQPMIVSDRVLVPARFISENLGASVQWNPEENKVIIHHLDEMKNNLDIEMTIGNSEVNILDYRLRYTKTLDVPPMIINDRTMVPLRFISEAFNCKVSWDSAQNYVVIFSPNFNGIVGD